ncbi:hypothetical protein PGTUg99_032355 [Puccinia graminis f. sp. tritici]|uniref:Uncharacterized protein n=1 Tax=Puccinia graminis f. sp. tritici TaxID=56615 RepID=A0A5B0RMK8_PUCGR|nr:hypothetical protein PGTUg99_032355 [Puccinia graminis f. sp. tritici]
MSTRYYSGTQIKMDVGSCVQLEAHRTSSTGQPVSKRLATTTSLHCPLPSAIAIECYVDC